MKKLLLCSVAALGLLGFTACGGSDKKHDDVEDAGTIDAGVSDAGTTDAGTDAGTIDAGHDDDAGIIDAGHDDAGIDAGPGPGPEGFEACAAEDDYGDVDFVDGQELDSGEGYYYDWGYGSWETEAYLIAAEDTEVWVNVNNGYDAETTMGPGTVGENGTFELGDVYSEDGTLYCLSSDGSSPAACAAVFIYGDEDTSAAYQMFSGTLTLSTVSETKLAGSISNGYFFPWESWQEDGAGGHTWCYVPPISFSFEADLEEGETL